MAKAMIRIKRVYDPVGKEDGKRFLVDRLWPRGLSKETAKIDLWMREIAPSDSLRRWFGHDPGKWELFRERYLKELEDKKELIEELKRQERKHGLVTLLYAAKDSEHNNAVALASFLSRKFDKV